MSSGRSLPLKRCKVRVLLPRQVLGRHQRKQQWAPSFAHEQPRGVAPVAGRVRVRVRLRVRLRVRDQVRRLLVLKPRLAPPLL